MFEQLSKMGDQVWRIRRRDMNPSPESRKDAVFRPWVSPLYIAIVDSALRTGGSHTSPAPGDEVSA